ncbi:MAG TPA: sterol desaturase family protein [Chitinophagaceae bacterium]|nr:sterol desaturase family protein [Chitinophagaceae bacterium]
MNTFLNQIIDLASTPVFLFIILLEIWLSNRQGRPAYSKKDTLHNFGISLLAGGVDLVMRGISLAVLSFFWDHSFFLLAHTVVYWIGLLLLVDCMHYWLHRLSHSCRFFWAVHVVHHSSNHFNWSVGFRAGTFESCYRFLFFIPIAVAGFRPIDIFFIYSITEIWALFTHTEMIKRMGWLEKILVTPSHHRVHHGSNTKYLDKNIATVFICWDKLFGTFQEELPAAAYEPIRYGIKTGPEKDNLGNIIGHEWKAIWQDLQKPGLRFDQKWMYLFGPPGWSHDGSRQTSKQLQRRELVSNKANAQQAL